MVHARCGVASKLPHGQMWLKFYSYPYILVRFRAILATMLSVVGNHIRVPPEGVGAGNENGKNASSVCFAAVSAVRDPMLPGEIANCKLLT